MIDVLLATYNGERYLAEQLESICRQDCHEWRIFLFDDGSDDRTLEIVRRFSQVLGDRLVFLGTNNESLGPLRAFSLLLAKSTASYRMFCDQDDVWRADKISKTLEAMHAAEARYGANTPLLVHTDLSIVDGDLNMVAPSFWKYQNLSPGLGNKLNRLLTQNVVTGCTIMINRPLAMLASTLPAEATMHDWWLALLANLFGKVVFLEEPTVLYRQHGKNVVGARAWGVRRVWNQATRLADARKSILQSIQQADALLNHYRSEMTERQRTMVAAYAHITGVSRVQRMRAVAKYRFFKYGLLRNIGFLAHLLRLDRVGI